MSITLLLLVFLGCALAAFFLGLQRSIALSGHDPRSLHSRPAYYGYLTALYFLIFAIGVTIVWSITQVFYLNGVILESMPGEYQVAPDSVETGLAIGTIKSLASRDVLGNVADWQIVSVNVYQEALASARTYMAIVALAAGLMAAGYIYSTMKGSTRARNQVEFIVKLLLIACASVAILTTVGIVFSMIFETLRFFDAVAPTDFFFGLVWDPGYTAAGAETDTGEFGVIPLLAGTMYVAFIALLVAVPIGLMSATYLAEYASPKVRATAKPLLEILAGVPTVVYGFFALVTVGPALSAFGDSIGLDINARSVLTAGVVMGIMIIPFISSLSDDVITQVPRSLREGSLGLGATKSETIRKVIFPAAIPGIVGSILLAASRAIGETMIVVMAAGVSPNLSANPFEAMTTVTVKIVTQLTGDADFTSPQALVAFALGMTLFIITLGMNIYALHIVRKYREQYD